MEARKATKEIEFLAGRKGTFVFECKACGRCCGEYTILLTPYDVIRLRCATGLSTGELIREGTIGITRMPFKQAFGFGPIADMFDMFGLVQNDIVPVAALGFRKRAGEKKECGFLSVEKNGRRLCEIYKDRPGMCRLHPIGCVTICGRRRWFYRRPLCDARNGRIHTVGEWLKESHVQPFLDANGRYLRWMRALLEDKELFERATEADWKTLGVILFDFDSYGACNMESIEREFEDWLARMIHGKTKGGRHAHRSNR